MDSSNSWMPHHRHPNGPRSAKQNICAPLEHSKSTALRLHHPTSVANSTSLVARAKTKTKVHCPAPEGAAETTQVGIPGLTCAVIGNLGGRFYALHEAEGMVSAATAARTPIPHHDHAPVSHGAFSLGWGRVCSHTGDAIGQGHPGATDPGNERLEHVIRLRRSRIHQGQGVAESGHID